MRKILTFRRYFLDFYEQLEAKAQEKVDYALMLLKTQNRISAKFVKPLEDGIYELRAVYGDATYRILFCFDEGDLIVLMNSFQKKTRKTPRAVIDLAKKIRSDYYESKGRH